MAFPFVQNETYSLQRLTWWFQEYKSLLTFQDFPRLFCGSAGEDFGNIRPDFSVRAGHLLPSDHTDTQTVPCCLVEHLNVHFFHFSPH